MLYWTRNDIGSVTDGREACLQMQNTDRNLYQRLSCLAAADPDKPLLMEGSIILTASGLYQRTISAAAAFSRIGIGHGSLVALFVPRGLNASVALLALRFTGAVIVLCDPRQSLANIQKECEAELPLSFSLRFSDPDTVIVTQLSTGLETAISHLSELPRVSVSDSSCDPDGAAFLLFTSGSTGKKKAVVLSENNLITDLLVSEPLGMYLPDDIALGALPLDHVFGLVLLLGVPVLGYALYYPLQTDASSLLAAIEQARITRMNGVPSLYLRMAEHAEEYDVSSLRAGFIAGGPVTPEQFVKIERKLGMTLVSVYGMTECIGISCSCWLDPQDVRAGGVGPFYAVNTGRIVLEDGTPAAPGQIGEVCVSGPMRMLGYYGEQMDTGELLRTGDLGYLDKSGVLHLCGRKKDIIIRNGYNLSAARIEAALLSLPDITAAVVVGLPDAVQGEVPCAMIVGHADQKALQALLHKNEIPVRIRSVSAIPATPLGKPDKQAIREALCI